MSVIHYALYFLSLSKHHKAAKIEMISHDKKMEGSSIAKHKDQNVIVREVNENENCFTGLIGVFVAFIA